jgi:hypothetical protein
MAKALACITWSHAFNEQFRIVSRQLNPTTGHSVAETGSTALRRDTTIWALFACLLLLVYASGALVNCNCSQPTVTTFNAMMFQKRCAQTRRQQPHRHACITGACSSPPVSVWQVFKAQTRVQSKGANSVTQHAVQSSSVQL